MSSYGVSRIKGFFEILFSVFVFRRLIGIILYDDGANRYSATFEIGVLCFSLLTIELALNLIIYLKDDEMKMPLSTKMELIKKHKSVHGVIVSFVITLIFLFLFIYSM